MATRKCLFLICEIPNFANAYIGKITKCEGYSLFHFGFLSNLLAGRWKTAPPPGMNRVKSVVAITPSGSSDIFV